jgi:signal transduction histidine kinase
MGGEVRIESTRGKGTRLEVRVPASSGEISHEKAAAAAATIH